MPKHVFRNPSLSANKNVPWFIRRSQSILNKIAGCAKMSGDIGLHYKQRRLIFADLIGILCWTCDPKAQFPHPNTINFVKRD